MGDRTETRTIKGYPLFTVASALQKCIRRGCEYDACWWAIELCESQYDNYMWKRLSVIAVEDVGLADPEAIRVVNSCRETWVAFRKTEKGKAKLPEFNIVTMAVLYLCRANKNREADDLAWILECKRKGEDIRTKEKLTPEKLPVPKEAIDGHTPTGRSKLHAEAKRLGIPWLECWNREFYGAKGQIGVAACNKPVKLDGEVDWMEACAKTAGCDIETYRTPASTVTYEKGDGTPSGASSGESARELEPGPTDEAPKADFKMKEKEDGTVEVVGRSGKAYTVNTNGWKCTCETYEDEGSCKHTEFVKQNVASR